MPPLRYLGLVIGIAALGLAGYGGYLLYPRFGLPGAAGAGLLVLAGAAGTASFFSPCSFPLLVTLLARQTGIDDPRPRRIRRALVFAAALSLGAAVFVLGVGSLIALGGRELAGAVTFTSPAGRGLRAGVGLALVVLGLAQAGRISLSFHGVERAVLPLLQSQALLRRRRPAVGFALFGFGYLLAGFG